MNSHVYKLPNESNLTCIGQNSHPDIISIHYSLILQMRENVCENESFLLTET